MSDAASVDYDGLIPNNVGLNADPRLRRALESWHPRSLDWWREPTFLDPDPPWIRGQAFG